MAIAKILTLRCREASALLSAAEDGPLSRTNRWALRLHLLTCGLCRVYRRQLQTLRRIASMALQRLQEDQHLGGMTLSEQARRRLRRALDGDAD